jgi:hypothetical protein
MDPQAPSFGVRLWRALRNLTLGALFLALAGAAAYGASVVNAHSFRLEVRDGQLIVLKGRFLPLGADPWVPSDPQLADAYAPLDLEGNTSAVAPGQRFDERDELDRTLYQVLQLLARPRLSSDLPRDLEKALGYVRRAERLSGLSPEQRVDLKRMQQDLAFFLAQRRLDDARRELEEALGQLKLAAESDSRHRSEAGLMLVAVEPQVKLLATTLRSTATLSRALDPKGGAASAELAKALAPQFQEVFDALQRSGAVGPAPALAGLDAGVSPASSPR